MAGAKMEIKVCAKCGKKKLHLDGNCIGCNRGEAEKFFDVLASEGRVQDPTLLQSDMFTQAS